MFGLHATFAVEIQSEAVVLDFADIFMLLSNVSVTNFLLQHERIRHSGHRFGQHKLLAGVHRVKQVSQHKCQ